MLSLKNKIVFITGADHMVGKACARLFAEKKTRLILIGEQLSELESLGHRLRSSYHVEVMVFQVDIRRKSEIVNLLRSFPPVWSDIDVFVNSAELAMTSTKFLEGNTEHWDTMIDTNLRGFLYLLREILPSMVKRNQGHIINIGSTAGYENFRGSHVYSATKQAVKSISRSLREELKDSDVRVTDIDPGVDQVEMLEIQQHGDEKRKAFFSEFRPIMAEEIAQAVVYAAARSLWVNIAEMTIYPSRQSTAGTAISKSASEDELPPLPIKGKSNNSAISMGFSSIEETSFSGVLSEKLNTRVTSAFEAAYGNTNTSQEEYSLFPQEKISRVYPPAGVGKLTLGNTVKEEKLNTLKENKTPINMNFAVPTPAHFRIPPGAVLAAAVRNLKNEQQTTNNAKNTDTTSKKVSDKNASDSTNAKVSSKNKTLSEKIHKAKENFSKKSKVSAIDPNNHLDKTYQPNNGLYNPPSLVSDVQNNNVDKINDFADLSDQPLDKQGLPPKAGVQPPDLILDPQSSNLNKIDIHTNHDKQSLLGEPLAQPGDLILDDQKQGLDKIDYHADLSGQSLDKQHMPPKTGIQPPELILDSQSSHLNKININKGKNKQGLSGDPLQNPPYLILDEQKHGLDKVDYDADLSGHPLDKQDLPPNAGIQPPELILDPQSSNLHKIDIPDNQDKQGLSGEPLAQPVDLILDDQKHGLDKVNYQADLSDNSLNKSLDKKSLSGNKIHQDPDLLIDTQKSVTQAIDYQADLSGLLDKSLPKISLSGNPETQPAAVILDEQTHTLEKIDYQADLSGKHSDKLLDKQSLSGNEIKENTSLIQLESKEIYVDKIQKDETINSDLEKINKKTNSGNTILSNPNLISINNNLTSLDIIEKNSLVGGNKKINLSNPLEVGIEIENDSDNVKLTSYKFEHVVDNNKEIIDVSKQSQEGHLVKAALEITNSDPSALVSYQFEHDLQNENNYEMDSAQKEFQKNNALNADPAITNMANNPQTELMDYDYKDDILDHNKIKMTHVSKQSQEAHLEKIGLEITDSDPNTLASYQFEHNLQNENNSEMNSAQKEFQKNNALNADPVITNMANNSQTELMDYDYKDDITDHNKIKMTDVLKHSQEGHLKKTALEITDSDPNTLAPYQFEHDLQNENNYEMDSAQKEFQKNNTLNADPAITNMANNSQTELMAYDNKHEINFEQQQLQHIAEKQAYVNAESLASSPELIIEPSAPSAALAEFTIQKETVDLLYYIHQQIIEAQQSKLVLNKEQKEILNSFNQHDFDSIYTDKPDNNDIKLLEKLSSVLPEVKLMPIVNNHTKIFEGSDNKENLQKKHKTLLSDYNTLCNQVNNAFKDGTTIKEYLQKNYSKQIAEIQEDLKKDVIHIDNLENKMNNLKKALKTDSHPVFNKFIKIALLSKLSPSTNSVTESKEDKILQKSLSLSSAKKI